jgi:hypothetical protein
MKESEGEEKQIELEEKMENEREYRQVQSELIESSLKLWREKIMSNKRKELTPGELSSMFQNNV